MATASMIDYQSLTEFSNSVALPHVFYVCPEQLPEDLLDGVFLTQGNLQQYPEANTCFQKLEPNEDIRAKLTERALILTERPDPRLQDRAYCEFLLMYLWSEMKTAQVPSLRSAHTHLFRIYQRAFDAENQRNLEIAFYLNQFSPEDVVHGFWARYLSSEYVCEKYDVRPADVMLQIRNKLETALIDWASILSATTVICERK